MSRAFAFGAGAWLTWACFTSQTPKIFAVFIVAVVASAFLTGRGFKLNLNIQTRATAAAHAQAAAIAQGGSVHLHVHQNPDVDNAVGFERGQFLDGLRQERPASLEAFGLDAIDGIPYLPEEAETEPA